MGEYEPNDSRAVTQSTHTAPGEPPRTGPREDQARRQAEQDEERKEGESQPGYGNARDEGGRREQDVAESGDPETLRRDAERPLGKG